MMARKPGLNPYRRQPSKPIAHLRLGQPVLAAVKPPEPKVEMQQNLSCGATAMRALDAERALLAQLSRILSCSL